MQSSMQRPDPPDLESIIGERISSLCSIYMDTAGKVKELIWMNWKVMRVSEGNCLVGTNAQTNCLPKHFSCLTCLETVRLCI